MTFFFVSDLHLNEQFPASYHLFVKFFQNLPESTKAVYILGDLFEFWIDDDFSNVFINNIKNILHKATYQCPIYLIKGNRDFLVGNIFAKQTNVTILDDLYSLRLYSKNILLTHGDNLCTLDKRHVCFTKIIRHPITVNIANILPIKLKLLIANKIRSISKNKYREKNKNARLIKLDQNIYDVCPETVKNIMVKYSFDLLIHGHTHKPNIYYDQNFTRIVLGDWHDSAKILVLNENGYTLKTICL